MWWGPEGVQETGSITSNKMGGSGGRMLSLRNVWTNFRFSFMTVAKGHLLWTAFLDFLNKYSKDSV